MTLRNIFHQSPAFSFQNNIFCQRGFQGLGTFEKVYLSLREKENRVYPDELVKVLPAIPSQHALRKEWRMRQFTLKKLVPYLSKKKHPKILELGCGNGWLCNHLATLPDSEVMGVDVNKTELIQGSRVFTETKNLCFAYADILTASLPYSHFDYIILSGSIQYFMDINILFAKLFSLLADNGEIHLTDSPIYKHDDIALAQIRSKKYFSTHNSEMEQYYYHHSWDSLKKFNYRVLFNPSSIQNRITGFIRPASPFPWLRFIK